MATTYSNAITILGTRGSLHRGGAGVRGRDPFDVAKDRIGNWAYHTVGEREEAIKTMQTEFNSVMSAMGVALGWSKDAPSFNEHDPRYPWFHTQAVPLFNEWEKWSDGELSSYWSRFATSWGTIEGWKDRLLAFRQAAASAGFDLGNTVDVAPLPTTVFESVTTSAGNFFRALKWILFGLVGIGSLFLIIQLWKGKL